jgi:hypothetical protein
LKFQAIKTTVFCNRDIHHHSPRHHQNCFHLKTSMTFFSRIEEEQ